MAVHKGPLERVIAIDPGERAGWASAWLGPNTIEHLEHGVLAAAEMADHLFDLQLGGQGPGGVRAFDVVTYETWRPRPKQGSMNWIQGNQLLSAQLVGQIRLVGRRSGAKLVGYGPDRKSVAMASMPALMEARLGLCHEQHDQDALMHLWMYAFENWVTDPPNVAIKETT